MSRCRSFACLGLSIALHSSFAATFTRRAMLEEMALHCVATGLAEEAASARQLSRAADDLFDRPSREALQRTQKAWIELALTHARNRSLDVGPVKDSAFWTALFYRQPLDVAVENVIRRSRPIDADFIELLGSSAKGLYAIEFLIFDVPQGPASRIGSDERTSPRLSAGLLLEGETASRRRRFVRELARDLSTRLTQVERESRDRAFAESFASGADQSVDLLFSQVSSGIEFTLMVPLRTYLEQAPAGRLRFNQVEGSPSGVSLDLLQASLTGLQRYYEGAGGMGMDDYVAHVNPALAKRLELKFQNATRALRAIPNPFEEALAKQRAVVEQARDECKALEILFKVDVAAALGVTILFGGNDGD